MRIVLDEHSLGTGSQGLEIGIRGFPSNPSDPEDFPSQLYIEIYEGRLQIHVWDGASEDPKTIIIRKEGEHATDDPTPAFSQEGKQ